MEEKLEKLMKRLDKSLSKDKTMKKILIAISIFMFFLMVICSKLMFNLMNSYNGIIKLLLILIGGIFIFSSIVFVLVALDLCIKKNEKVLNVISLIIYLVFLIFWFGSLIYYDYLLINNLDSSSLKELLSTIFLYLPGLFMSYTTYRKIRYGVNA